MVPEAMWERTDKSVSVNLSFSCVLIVESTYIDGGTICFDNGLMGVVGGPLCYDDRCVHFDDGPMWFEHGLTCCNGRVISC